MKRHILSAVAMTILMVSMGVGSASAQDRVTATIPFAFHAGSGMLPAGDYDVRTLSASAMLVQNKDTREAVITIPLSIQAQTASQDAKLVFNRYGDQYFLSQVWALGSGRELPKSKLEREVARSASESARNSSDRVVYIAARLR